MGERDRVCDEIVDWPGCGGTGRYLSLGSVEDMKGMAVAVLVRGAGEQERDRDVALLS